MAGMPAASSVDVVALASRLRLDVMRLARKLRREGDVDVTPTLLSALSTIDRHGPMTAGALAAHEQVRKPTVTRLIGALVDRGLIERQPDPADGRVSWVRVSRDGVKFLRRIRRRTDEYLARRMTQLSVQELAILERASGIMERLTEDDR